MKMFLCLFIVTGLAGFAAVQGCAHCYRYHPQEMFCKSDFVVHVVIYSIESDVALSGYRFHSHNLVTAGLVADLKPSLEEDTEVVEFYSPSSICGTRFNVGGDFVVAGSFQETVDNVTYLLHGNCDYASEWSELSKRQKKGFEIKYKRLCDCTIQGVKAATNLRVSDLAGGSGYEGALSYWTPYKDCYYNPLKTERLQRELEDCEEEYGFCKRNANGECSWQMTTDYVNCFEQREQYVMALEGSRAITDIKQCNVLRNRRQRKKCRKRVRQNMSSSQSEALIPFESS